ncbi:MAG: hypothetical protein EPO16_04570 [Dehalococcoidia bacterium]|nr:MAG: hypothetical protein EPO16_04570 [Dehalococcoidia bacterium]
MRRFLPAGILVLVAALGCGAAGFVYAHEPARDQVILTVDHARPAASTAIVSGTVTRTGDGRLMVEGEGGTVELALPPGTALEELQGLPPSDLVTGARVNIGAERSDYGIALTGVVAVAVP